MGVNPPGFAWWWAKGAERHALTVRDSAGRSVYRAAALADPVHLPAKVLPPGAYAWDVEALDKSGAVIARRGFPESIRATSS